MAEGPLTKAGLALLERCFAAEINAALSGWPTVVQVNNKVARHLAADGYIQHVFETLGGRPPMRVEGYALTELGRLTYCTSDLCAEPDEQAGATDANSN